MIKRIESIDVLRGFALLGILLMNISSFSMPSMAYFSPNVYDVTILNHVVYSLAHVIADQKFMAIFSMLFGASTMLFVQSALFILSQVSQILLLMPSFLIIWIMRITMPLWSTGIRQKKNCKKS